MKKEKLLPPQIGIAVSMLIFGTIGIFRNQIPLSSGVVAFARGVVGTVFLILFMLITRIRPDRAQIRKNLPYLLLSGAFIGFNWILLFEAYKYTGVSVATLCYYMAPVFTILASPLVGERYSAKKLLCCAVALAGMVLVTGVDFGDFAVSGQLKGILFGLGAAVLYAGVVLTNKKMGDVEAFSKTAVQLGAASVALFPYVLFSGELTLPDISPKALFFLLTVGLMHTGVAYVLYFGGVGRVKAQTAALLSYIDPASALILSAVFLNESLGVRGIVGALLIIGAAIISGIEKKPAASKR